MSRWNTSSSFMICVTHSWKGWSCLYLTPSFLLTVCEPFHFGVLTHSLSVSQPPAPTSPATLPGLKIQSILKRAAQPMSCPGNQDTFPATVSSALRDSSGASQAVRTRILPLVREGVEVGVFVISFGISFNHLVLFKNHWAMMTKAKPR